MEAWGVAHGPIDYVLDLDPNPGYRNQDQDLNPEFLFPSEDKRTMHTTVYGHKACKVLHCRATND